MSNVSPIRISHHPARDQAAASVRAFIGHAGVSKSAVARAIGMAQSTFSRRTNGQEPFDMDELGSLADYFGVSVIDLLAGALPAVGNEKTAPTPKGEGRNVDPAGFEPTTSTVISGRFGHSPAVERPTLAPVTAIRA